MTHQEKWEIMEARRKNGHAKKNAVSPERIREARKLLDTGLAVVDAEALDAVEAYQEFVEARQGLRVYVQEHE